MRSSLIKEMTRIFLNMYLLKSLTAQVRNGAVLPSLFMILLGLIFITMMNSLVKYLGQSDYDGSFLAFMRNSSAMLTAMIMLWGRGYFTAKKRHYFKISSLKLMLLRSSFAIVSQISFFTSLRYIELGTARALSYTSSIFVTILAVMLLKEKCGIWRSSALVVGLLGTFLIVSEGASLEVEKLPYYLLTLFSAVCFACTLITLSFFARKDDNLVLIGYAQIMTTFLGAFALTFFFEWQRILTLEHLILMMLTGVFGTIGMLFITYAYRMSQVSLLAPFQYFGLIFALLFGWIFFGENPIDKLFPGALLIVGAGIVIAIRETIKKVDRPHQNDDTKI